MKWTVLGIILIGCCFLMFKTKKQPSKYTKVKLDYIVPFTVRPGLAGIDSMGFDIVYTSGYRLYVLRKHVLKHEIIGDTINLMDNYRKPQYFVCALGDSVGYFLEKLTDSFTIRKGVDSFLSQRALYKIKSDAVLPSVRLVRTYYTDNNDMVQVYAPKISQSRIDSLYYHYNADKRNIPFALSDKLDSQYQSKLYKTRLLTTKDTTAYADYMNQFRWISIEVTLMPITNTAELDSFFVRFKKHISQ